MKIIFNRVEFRDVTGRDKNLGTSGRDETRRDETGRDEDLKWENIFPQGFIKDSGHFHGINLRDVGTGRYETGRDDEAAVDVHINS